MDVEPRILVGGLLPKDRRLESQVRRALENKLQKLMHVDADIRLLLIDIPTHTDSDIAVARVIGELQHEFPLLARVNEVAFAKTFGFKSEGCIFFRTWNPQLRVWSDTFIATIKQPAMSPA
jgi:hypothetical protein